jgi:hypothetical protein
LLFLFFLKNPSGNLEIRFQYRQRLKSNPEAKVGTLYFAG